MPDTLNDFNKTIVDKTNTFVEQIKKMTNASTSSIMTKSYEGTYRSFHASLIKANERYMTALAEKKPKRSCRMAKMHRLFIENRSSA